MSTLTATARGSSERLLQDLVTSVAKREPSSPCVDDGVWALSYDTLEKTSNQLARLLLETGLEAGARVAIYAPKSSSVVVALLGVLKAGGVYVPVDPLAPPFRAHVVVEDCSPTHVIVPAERLEQWERERSLPACVRTVLILGACSAAVASQPRAATVVHFERYRELDAAELGAERRRRSTDLAYVLYTSGSTGKPKGVMLSHQNALAFVDWAHDTFQLTANDRVSSHAPFHFDLSVFDLYGAFRAGACVVLPTELCSHTPKLLLQLIREQRLSVWYSVPSVLRMLLEQTDFESAPPRTLRLILFAGEEFAMAPLRRLWRALPSARYFNLYGPTETNVCTFFEVREGDLERDSLPIGRACSGAKLSVRREDGGVASRGELGELYVQGPTVFLGYWPEPRPEAQEYATGDGVVLDEDGELLFRGRKDFMVKVRGFRVELREVELALLSQPGVHEAAVSLASDPRTGQQLVAHLVTDGSVSVLDIKRRCAERLPGYMVPARVQLLRELPKTSTGKIDRQRLGLAETDTKPRATPRAERNGE